MASSQTRPGSIPESFSPQERFLAEKTEEAIQDGVQLERWCHDPNRQIREFPLNLKKAFALPNQPAGYFGHVPINGKTESVMGVRQTVDFSRVAGANPGKQLRDFVLGEFLSRAHWTYPDNYPGGFTIEQSLYRKTNGEYGRFAEESRKGCIDWRRLGTEYTWVLLKVYIHDFVMNSALCEAIQRGCLCGRASRFRSHRRESLAGREAASRGRRPVRGLRVNPEQFRLWARKVWCGRQTVYVPSHRNQRNQSIDGLRGCTPMQESIRFRQTHSGSDIRRRQRAGVPYPGQLEFAGVP